ncbi:MAG: hypothetical protein RBU45_14415 [Myxococcota bacterium]|jgi:hypothetical protein|nr:hypothetical protein [Myxococcota bacterium]
MNENTRTQIAALEDMRLSGLQARYAEVIGEATRCPNRRWIIRRLTEALLAQAESEPPAAIAPVTPSEPSTAPAAETATPSATVSEPGMDVEQARRVIMENVDPMGYDTAEQYVEECYGQVAPEAMPGLLVEAARIIIDNAAAQAQQGDEAQATPEDVNSPVASENALTQPGSTPTTEQTVAAPAAPPTAVKLSKLSIPELQALYREVVGRDTGSSDRNYLIWKVNQAKKGKVPVGPRQSRRAEGEPADFKVLPLRMPTLSVARLDEVVQRLGLASRMELFRRSLRAFLSQQGEPEVAALFDPEA